MKNYPDPRPSFYTFISSDFKPDDDVRDQFVVDWHFIMNKYLIGKNFTLHVSNSFGSTNYTFNIGKMKNGTTSTGLNPATIEATTANAIKNNETTSTDLNSATIETTNSTVMPSLVGRASIQSLGKLYALILLLIVLDKAWMSL